MRTGFSGFSELTTTRCSRPARHARNRSSIIFDTVPSNRCPTRATGPPTCMSAFTATTVCAPTSSSVTAAVPCTKPGTAARIDGERVRCGRLHVGERHRPVEAAADRGEGHVDDGFVPVVAQRLEPLAPGNAARERGDVHQEVPDDRRWRGEGVEAMDDHGIGLGAQVVATNRVTGSAGSLPKIPGGDQEVHREPVICEFTGRSEDQRGRRVRVHREIRRSGEGYRESGDRAICATVNPALPDLLISL